MKPYFFRNLLFQGIDRSFMWLSHLCSGVSYWAYSRYWYGPKGMGKQKFPNLATKPTYSVSLYQALKTAFSDF